MGGRRPIVREHVAIDGIERRVVDVRREHAFFEIVEDDEARRAAQPAKRPLVELGPRLRARVPDEQAHRFARVAERQDEEPRASVLGRLRMTDHRAVAVVDLRFFTRCRRDDDARFDGRAAAQLADEATDAGVASGETLLHEVLPDRHRVAPQFQGCFDLLAVRRTRARRRRATRRRVGGHLRLGNCRFCGWVGGHLPGNGRFCRPFARAATAPHRQPRPSQVPRGRFAADVGRVRDPADGPTQTAQGQNLLLLLVVQDVAHPDEGLQSHRPRQRLGRRQLIAGFGCPPRITELQHGTSSLITTGTTIGGRSVPLAWHPASCRWARMLSLGVDRSQGARSRPHERCASTSTRRTAPDAIPSKDRSGPRRRKTGALGSWTVLVR